MGQEKRFNEEKIIGFSSEAETGVPSNKLCRRNGFSEASYYLWRSKFGGMSVPDAKRLKELKAENGRLKKPPAESLREMEVTREALSKKCEHPGTPQSQALFKASVLTYVPKGVH